MAIEAIYKRLAKSKQSYRLDQVEILRRAASAWAARAEEKNEEALRLMRSAADLEDSTEKHPVTPGPIIPARELLGDMLVEMNRPDQALREYESSLRDSPNRFNGLYGAARAASLSGDKKNARSFYAKLVATCEHADSERPEILEAKAFLASR